MELPFLLICLFPSACLDLKIVMFKINSKLYIAPDVEWLLCLVNGRIFCPQEIVRPDSPPHLLCDSKGCTTVANFEACFRDTCDAFLILELFQKLEICYRTGNGLQELVFPSLIRASDCRPHWSEAPESYKYMGTCIQCKGRVHFSASFFPKLQVRLHTMWRLRYGVPDVPLFAGGVKLILLDGPSPVEALVVLARGSFDTHIVVRARVGNWQRAVDLHQLLLDVTKDIAKDVSRGSDVTERSLAFDSNTLQVSNTFIFAIT